MNPYIEILRISKGLMASIAVLIGALIAGNFALIPTVFAMVGVFFIFGAGVVINDYYDYEIDKINAPKRPLSSEKISKKSAVLYTLALYSFGLIFSFLINYYCFILSIVNSVLLFFYAMKLKRIALLGNITDSWLTSTTFIFGALIVSNLQIVWILALLSFWVTLGREVFGDIEDIVGDRKLGAKTLPIITSEKFARIWAQIFMVIGIILSPLPYLFGFLNLFYIAIVAVADIIFIISLFQNAHSTQSTIQIGMIIALFAFIAGIFP